METVNVFVDNTAVMDRIESASISLKSPTGRVVILKKRTLMLPSVTSEMIAVFQKCCGDPMKKRREFIELTRQEMQVALNLSMIK